MPELSTKSREVSVIAGAEPVNGFADETSRTMSKVGRAVGKLIESLPGPIKTANDIHRVLGIDRALSWQIFRIGSHIDPISASPDMPRPGPMSKALRAAAAKGVSKTIISQVQEACDEFERLVERHAGDRGLFDSMARGVRPDTQPIPLRERRDAFRSNTAIWGVRLQTLYNLTIFHPSQDGKSEDVAFVSGFIKLCRLRSGMPETTFKFQPGTYDTPGAEFRSTIANAERPLDIVEIFSGPKSYKLRKSASDPNMVEMIPDGEIGRSGETTLFVREIGRAAGSLPQSEWGHTFRITQPIETLVADLLVPAGWSSPTSARVGTYSTMHGREIAAQHRDVDRMPVVETVDYIGQDINSMRTPHVPQCPELATKIIHDMGWASSKFDVYRCVVQYPIMTTAIVVNVEAAES